MKKVFILFLFFPSWARAFDREDLVKYGLKLLPARQEQAIIEYFNTIGYQVDGAANSKIKEENNRLLKNSCFNTLAANYYSSMAADAYAQPQYIKAVVEKAQNFGTTIKDLGLEPGYAFTTAKKIAHGNANLAMLLIGICGHDDANTIVVLKKPDVLTLRATEEKLKKTQPMRTNLIKATCLKTYIGHQYSSSADCERTYADFVKKETTLNSDDGSCPHIANPIYIPESLGPNADIDKKLKEQIVKIQSPHMGKRGIPYKYYHVLGSAYTSCILKRGGVPKFLAKFLVKKAITTYRNGRLCQAIKGQFNLDPSRYSAKKIAEELSAKTNAPPSQYTGMFIHDKDMPIQMIQEKLDNAQARYDAINMFKSSYSYTLSGNCSEIQLFDSARTYFKNNGALGSGAPCPTNLSAIRCKRARHMMATWAIDFDWSEAQHLAGLDFAYDNCTEGSSAEDLVAKACAAIEQKDPSQQTSGKITQ